MEARVCAECGRSLPAGVTDVFCPACALRGALAAVEIEPPMAQTSDAKNSEIPLASGENGWKPSFPMSTVAPRPGQLIGDYEILEQIGGNMGFVFKARHRLLDKVVALKLVPADWIADPARLARFQREMRVMGQLQHPNLVTASDARSVDDWHLVAMELIDGVDLLQLVRSRGPLPLAAACEVARQAAQGLQFAHEHSLIHRDIKPSNLMLTRAGIVKVIDMGLALMREDSTVQLTQTGIVMGTMSYCAPEQFRDASQVDIRADIYSLGCTLYHLLTGKAPYSPRKSFAEIMQAHLHEPFPSLTEALPDAPAGLAAAVARMTAKDREARYATPQEVAAALEPFARGAELGPLVPKVIQPSPPPHVASLSPKPTRARQPADREQRPIALWPRMVAVIVPLVAIAVAVLFAISRPSGDTVVSRTPTNSLTDRTVMNPVAVPTETNLMVVLMDSRSPRAVYDPETRNSGGSNAEVLSKIIRDAGLVPAESLYPESVGPDWNGWAAILARRPDLIVVHRSVFCHALIAKFGLGYPPFDDPEMLKLWQNVYQVGDEKLCLFMGYIAQGVPHTKFIVYSRGTDAKWLDPEFRQKWTKDLGVQFKDLVGRVDTMLIPNGTNGTFKDLDTAKDILYRIQRDLGPTPKRN